MYVEWKLIWGIEFMTRLETWNLTIKPHHKEQWSITPKSCAMDTTQHQVVLDTIRKIDNLFMVDPINR